MKEIEEMAIGEMTIEEMLNMINVPSINCMMMTSDAKQEILSRFAKLEKEIVRLEKSVNYKLVDNH